MSSYSGINLEKYLIPLDEINHATDNFSSERYIGGGGFGAVYKGQLSESWENRTVAVKRLDAGSHQGGREFRNEIELISIFHHENIIAFIGYCDEGGEMIIVYEYASNGSLDHHLQDPKKLSCITWAQRLEICIGATKGLNYLHSGLGEKNKVIHRDVKSANILLDGNMVAKICDFGLSKLGTINQPDTRLYTKVVGTQFYLDPFYLESGILRKESDVYSFGVVLFEIVSGMLVYRERRIGDERQSLMNTIRRYHENEPDKVVDPCIRDGRMSHSFIKFIEIAYQCISFNVMERPTLGTVIMKLEEALNIQISATTPADGSMIKRLIGKLNSASPYDQWIASDEIRTLLYYQPNRVAFVKAGGIPRLTQLLTAPNFRTQEHLLTVLQHLLREIGNRGIIISSGAVPGLVHILEKGSKVARECAADITYSLIQHVPHGRFFSVTDSNLAIAFGSAGAILPLVLLLSEGTTTGKKNASQCLKYLCINEDNRGRVVTAGIVPILLELLAEANGVLKEESVNLLYTLSCHPQGMLAIGEAEAVPHLIEVIGTGSQDFQEAAVAILVKLSSMDQKYLVEDQQLAVLMEKLKGIRQHGTDSGKRNARKLRRMIKDHQHLDYGSDTEVVGVADMLEPDPTNSWLVAIAKRISLICNIITTHSFIRE